MTEREDKSPAAPSGAAEEQEILLDSPIVESEDGPGAVDAPGVSGSEEPGGGDGVQPVEQCNAGDEEQAADEGAHAGKRVGAHIVHSYALGDEGHSPNDGGEEQQKGVPELQRVHGRCDSLRRPGMQ